MKLFEFLRKKQIETKESSQSNWMLFINLWKMAGKTLNRFVVIPLLILISLATFLLELNTLRAAIGAFVIVIGTKIIQINVVQWILEEGFKTIPVAHKGILLVMGKRMGEGDDPFREPIFQKIPWFLKKNLEKDFKQFLQPTLDEGKRWVIPKICDIKNISIERITKKILIDKIYVPKGKAELSIKAAITYGPNPENPSGYLNIKDPEGQLEGMIKEAVRSFGGDPGGEPQTWQTALHMGEKFASAVIARVILGKSFPKYSTKEEILSLLQTQEEGDEFVKDWEDPEKPEIKPGMFKKERHMTQEELGDKRKTKEAVRNLASDGDPVPIKKVELVVYSFNIESVEPSPALKEAIERESKEEQEKNVETKEARTVAEVVKAFIKQSLMPDEEVWKTMTSEEQQKKLREIDEEVSRRMKDSEYVASMIRKFQIERGKMKGSVQEFVVNTDNPSMANMLSGLAKRFLGGE